MIVGRCPQNIESTARSKRNRLNVMSADSEEARVFENYDAILVQF